LPKPTIPLLVGFDWVARAFWFIRSWKRRFLPCNQSYSDIIETILDFTFVCRGKINDHALTLIPPNSRTQDPIGLVKEQKSSAEIIMLNK
jgi:hypothetical protein